MSAIKVYADDFERTFAQVTDLMDFLKERMNFSSWMRKPAKNLRVVPLEMSDGLLAESEDEDWEHILEDTKRNTDLMLKVSNQAYPLRDCATKTLLERAGISGTALRKLERKDYAKILNLCLKVARGDALIKVADGKVSAVHAGDHSDYSVLEPEAIFAVTIDYLDTHYPGNKYLEFSGSYDHVALTAMWELGRQQELLEPYHEALQDSGLEDLAFAPAVRLVTSDVGVSGVNLYPMILCDSNNRCINLGTPIRLPHKAGASIRDYQKNLDMLYAKYQDAVSDLTKLMGIEIANPINCLTGALKRVNIPKKIAVKVINLFEAKYGENPCTAHDLYYAMNEAPFFAACDGFSGNRILTIEENVARALSLDWEEYDVVGAIKW